MNTKLKINWSRVYAISSSTYAIILSHRKNEFSKTSFMCNYYLFWKIIFWLHIYKKYGSVRYFTNFSSSYSIFLKFLSFCSFRIEKYYTFQRVIKSKRHMNTLWYLPCNWGEYEKSDSWRIISTLLYSY